jgi:hypothetical protein
MLDTVPFAEITALIALAVSVLFGWMTQQHSKSELRLEFARDKSEREAELKKWIREVVEAFTALHTSDQKEKLQAAHRLSSLADFGRLFFPNDRDDYRSRLLDPIIHTVLQFEDDTLTDPKLRTNRKEFIKRINAGAYVSPFDIETSPEACASQMKKA